MSDSSRERLGRGERGVVREIDEQLQRVEQRLAGYQRLVAERERLLGARAALTGEPLAGRRGRVSQEDVAAYLAEHPGSLPARIAQALGVPVTNVSAHLYRGKTTRFRRDSDGWHLNEPGTG